MVDPLGLVLKAAVWYLVARVDGTERVYRLSRMSAVEPTGVPFDRPPGFDLPAFWAAYQEAFEPDGDDGWTRRTVWYERIDWAAAELLRLGPVVEVLEPPELREAVAAGARAVAALYDADRSQRTTWLTSPESTS